MFGNYLFFSGKIKFVTLFALVFGLLCLARATASSHPLALQPAAHPILQPDGVDDSLAEGDDFARAVLGNPWDMDAITDIYNEKSQGLRDVAAAGGVLRGVTTDDDPGIYLLWPGFVGDLPSIGTYGVNTPIQADHYRLLSFRLYADQEGNGQVYWFQDAKLTRGTYGVSTWFRVRPGWHVYTLDLATIEQVEGTLAWAGEIQGLRLDPINLRDSEVKLDWVRLTPDDSQTAYTIAWPATSLNAQSKSYFPLITQDNRASAQAVSVDPSNRFQAETLPSAVSGQRINLYADTDSQWSNGVFSTITTTAPISPPTYRFQTSVLPPDDYYVVAETGSDYASLTYDNAWDMADASDISVSFNLENATFENGVLHSPGTRKGWPYFAPRYDYRQPIDAGIFTQLSMRMYSSRTDQWTLAWWDNDENAHSYSPDPMPTVAGWNTYTLDLAGKPGWSDQIRNIQIRPVFSTTVDIQIDWIALTPGTIPASESELGVARSYSPGPLTVTAAPNLHITRPSMDSGEDYATATFGQPWGMDNEDSIDSSFDLREINFNGDVLNAGTGSTNDPFLFLRTGGFQTATPIDADRYKYLTYRLYVEGKQDTLYGWVTRLLWWGSAGVSTHRDIVVNEGWNNYRVDLSKNDVESESQATDWKGTISAVRFDPHETLAPTSFHLDYVYLRAPDRANTSFSITWAGSYGQDSLVDLYYDTDTDPAVKTPIVAGIAASTLSYIWNTALIPAGEYFIYQVARDGYNSIGRYSETPIIISHSAFAASVNTSVAAPASPAAAPVGSVARAASASGEWTTYNDLELVTALVADGSAVWAGTRGGLARWNTPSQSAKYFTTVDGLSNNIVYAGAVDANGDRWFGTADGVSRFDGQTWTRYTLADGLADNRVYAVAVDAQGRKWFGTHRGVSRFDGGAWQTFNTAQGLAKNLVRALTVGPDGAIWLGTDGGGLSRFDGQTWTTWTTADGLISNHIWALRVDSAGRLWVGTDVGVSRFTGLAWTSYRVADGLAAPFVRGIAQDASGALWFATQGGGLSRFDGTTWSSYDTAQGLLDAAVYAVAVDSAGTVWAGSARGLNRFDGTVWTGIPLSGALPDNYVTAIVRDGAGNTWFATPSGAVQFDGSHWRVYTTADGLLSNRVQDIAFDQQGNRWFATDAGVSRFDGSQWTSFTEKNTADQPGGGMLHSNTTSLAVDTAGRVWMGNWLGVSAYDGASWQVYELKRDTKEQYVYDLAASQDGSVWGATLGGIFRFYNGTSSKYTVAHGLVDNRVRALAMTPNGVLWAGTYAGVSRYDGNTWESWQSADGLVGDFVVSAATDQRGIVWFGTYGNGVSSFDGSTWRSYTTMDGLADNYVFAILPDSSTQRWFGTFGGVSKQNVGGHSIYLPVAVR